MKSEYTKGEWNKDGNRVKVHGRGIIAICPSPTEDYGVVEFIANARLIAQAPKLYEALKALVLNEKECGIPEGQSVIRARQAIASVEGE